MRCRRVWVGAVTEPPRLLLCVLPFFLALGLPLAVFIGRLVRLGNLHLDRPEDAR